MADAIPMLRREQRRHLLMNGWLIAGFIVVGTAVTNERGIFRPLGFESAMPATARAFIAIASPAGLTDGDRLRDVRSVSSLSPFEVTAPSRDLRRRLIDAIDWVPGEGDDPLGNQQPLSFAQNPVNPNQVALNDPSPSDLPAAFSTPPEALGVQNPNLPVDPNAVPNDPNNPTGAVPEPATWAMLIAGFGFMGGILRLVDRRHRLLLKPVVRRRKGRSQAAA